MFFQRLADRFLDFLKRAQRFYYAAEYRELAARLPPFGFSISLAEEKIESILIYKPDDIGDCVYSLPAIVELKRAYPEARFYLICQAMTRPLFERAKLFDKIASVKVDVRFRRFSRFDWKSALRELDVEKLDLAIYLRSYPALFSQFLKVPARFKIHPEDPRMRSKSILQSRVNVWDVIREHQALQMLQIVSPLVGKTFALGDVTFPRLKFTQVDQNAEAWVREPFILIHPYAKDETRFYPVAYWRKIVEGLRENFSGQLVIVGAIDDPVFPELGDVVNLQGKLTLAQTSYLMTRAKAFFGTASGPAHLAAALGAPTVVFWGGPATVEEWGMLANALILKEPVACSPCHSRTCLGFGLICLTRLTPDKVWPVILEFLKGKI